MNQEINNSADIAPKKGRKRFRRVTGVFFITVGLIALVTPFTPGSWLIFVGLETLGVHVVFWEKLAKRYKLKKPEPQSN